MITPARKQIPLYKRLRKYFDSATIALAKTAKANTPVDNEDGDFVEVPITIGFGTDLNSMVGTVRISKDAAKTMKLGMVLSPSYMNEPEHRLIGFGAIPAEQSVPPEKRDKSKSSFIWHLMLIAIASGFITIIALIIRLFYVRVGS